MRAPDQDQENGGSCGQVDDRERDGRSGRELRGTLAFDRHGARPKVKFGEALVPERAWNQKVFADTCRKAWHLVRRCVKWPWCTCKKAIGISKVVGGLREGQETNDRAGGEDDELFAESRGGFG